MDCFPLICPNYRSFVGWEIHPVHVNIHWRLHNCFCKRMASCIGSVFMHPCPCHRCRNNGEDHDWNVKPRTSCLCKCRECSGADYRRDQNGKTKTFCITKNKNFLHTVYLFLSFSVSWLLCLF